MLRRPVLLIAIAVFLGACTAEERQRPVPQPSPETVQFYSDPLVNVSNVPWRRLESSPDGRTVTLVYPTSDPECFHLDRAEVDYGTEAVTVSLFVGMVPPGDQYCASISLHKSVDIRLSSPLGDRRLVDGFDERDS